MIEEVTSALESSIFVRYPGYIFAPIMFIIASTITIAYQRYRFQQTFSLADIIEHTIAWRGWKSKSAIIDVVMYVVGRILPVISSNALAFALAGLVVWMMSGFTENHTVSDPGMGIIIASSLILVVLLDMGDYFAHCVLHKVPFLWELHKVHHSATFLSPVTSFRAHPLESLIYTACHSITIAPALGLLAFFYNLAPVDLINLMFMTNLVMLVLTMNHLKHSHFQISLGVFDFILVSPHMHQLHHSIKIEHWDKNMGLIFSIWDWAFGTAVRQDTKIPVAYGIGRGPEVDAQYQSLYGVFFRPLVNMARMAFGQLPADPPLDTEPPIPTVEAGLARSGNAIDPGGLSEPNHT